MQDYPLEYLADNSCEHLELADIGGGTGLPDEAPLTQWEKVLAAGMREEYESRLADDRRNAAECERLRQLAEASASADGVTGEYLPRYLDTFVATRERLAEEEAEERRA